MKPKWECMTNVPTDRTDELLEQNAVEQAVEATTLVEAQAKESQKDPQIENAEAGVTNEFAEVTEAPKEATVISTGELTAAKTEMSVAEVEEPFAEAETLAVPVVEKETVQEFSREETETDELGINFEEDDTSGKEFMLIFWMLTKKTMSLWILIHQFFFCGLLTV